MATLPTENVQTYPRPPALEPVAQRIVVVLGGRQIASSAAAWRVLETHHPPTYYIPREDVSAELRLARGRSFCEWKGEARYFDVVSGSATARRAAWTYEGPSPRFAQIAGHLAFYPSLMEACRVGDAPVSSQPGDFYGGWVTPNLTGVPKGGPGTLHW